MKFLQNITAVPALLLSLCTIFADAEETFDGRAIYTKLCAECHGDRGEGVDGLADEPLYGDRTIESLTGRIERTMPEDEEHLCVGPEARAVAEYIYDAFYSVEARARNTPARIEVARLTVPQYRNSVADLVLGFRGNIWIKEERGLKATYYGGRRFNERKEFVEKATKEAEAQRDKELAKQKNEKQGNKKDKSAKNNDKSQKPPPLKREYDRFDRNDPRVKLDFGTGIPPFPEAKQKGFSNEQFSIRWEGTLFAEDTGEYEFVIRTRNGATLWVNEDDHSQESPKTIDAWVAPDNKVREETGKVFLIGGRPYPIRLEFFKYKEEQALIELLWKPPHDVLQPIASRSLSPHRISETLAVGVPFPADDRSVGYERGTNVSKGWFEAVTAGAGLAADYVVDNLDRLARTKSSDPERSKKIKQFGRQFAERAFRRPLSEDECKKLIDPHFASADSIELGLKRLVLMTLTSPRFLYPDLPRRSGTDSWDIANRLALFLWDSLPDQRLRDLAAKGDLVEPQRITAEADRMVKDWRSRAKVRGFFHHWLELERAANMSKDKSVFPEFTDAVMADLRTSLYLWLDEAVWSENGNYRQLFLDDQFFLNQRLGKLYGKSDIEGGFQKVSLKGRSGVITHPFLLSNLAYHNSTSPIHRGVFLTRNILGMTLKSPPMANVFKEGDFDPNLTMREKVTEMTRSKACMGCHVTINPLGFSLENYDGIGRWQNRDQNKPIDPKSDFKTDTGETIRLNGARDVAKFAANSPTAHRAFVEQLFHHLVKQPVRAYGSDKMELLRKEFEQSGFRIPDLMKEIAVTAATEGPGAADGSLAEN